MNDLIHEIAQMIEASSGFVVSEQGYPTLQRFVDERVDQGGFAGVERYVDYLRRHPDSKEWRHILSKITIKESYLFRARAQFDALSKTVLDELAQQRTGRQLRVWCAGCARGEEAATLAIVLADHPVVGDWSWSVLATDVDETALFEARKAVYGSRAVSRVPAETLARHFVRRGDKFELDRKLLSRIEFRRLNLAEHDLKIGEGEFDVVFLRNVLIYFRPELQRAVVENVEQSLAADGFLFLGPSESLIHLGTRLHARDLGDCFCYERAPADPRHDSPSIEAGASSHRSPTPASDGLPARTDSEHASEPPPPFDHRLESMIDALARGESSRAVVGLASLRHDRPESAVAHALEGIALERNGDHHGAARAYRAALYLAPEMDEIRFLLAQVLERLGRTVGAAREYRTALSGLGPAASDITEILGRLGFPDSDQMSQICREKIS